MGCLGFCWLSLFVKSIAITFSPAQTDVCLCRCDFFLSHCYFTIFPSFLYLAHPHTKARKSFHWRLPEHISRPVTLWLWNGAEKKTLSRILTRTFCLSQTVWMTRVTCSLKSDCRLRCFYVQTAHHDCVNQDVLISPRNTSLSMFI